MKGPNDKTLYEFFIDDKTGETSFKVNMKATEKLSDNKKMVLLTSLETVINKVKELIDGEIPDLGYRDKTVTIKKGAVSFEAEINSEQVIELRPDQAKALMMTLDDVTRSIAKMYMDAKLKNKPFDKPFDGKFFMEN